MQMCWI